MELAALAARVDGGGQVVEQRRVEIPAGESSIELSWIDARNARDETGGDHLAREPRRIRLVVVEQRRPLPASFSSR